MATYKEESVRLQIPKLAQDLIAGTCGGWAQVIVGKYLFKLDPFFLYIKYMHRPPF